VTPEDLELFFPSRTAAPFLRLLLASAIFHRAFLLKKLPPNQSFCYSALFQSSEVVERLAKKVIHGFESSYMTATGIPPWKSVVSTLKSLDVKLKELPPKLLDNIKKLLEEHGAVGGNNIPFSLRKTIKETVSATVREHFQAHLSPVREMEDVVHPLQESIAIPQPVQYDIYRWSNGNQSVFPENLQFPAACDLPTAWSLWHIGAPADHLPPFRFLTTRDLGHDKKRTKILSVWNCLMRAIIEALGPRYTLSGIQVEYPQHLMLAELQLGVELLFGEVHKTYQIRPLQWSVQTALKELRELRKNSSEVGRKRGRKRSRHEVEDVDADDEMAVEVVEAHRPQRQRTALND